MNDGQDWEQVVWKKDNTTTNIINNKGYIEVLNNNYIIIAYTLL